MDNDEKIELQPATIVIFGVTGDLSTRKLLPSLYELNKNRLLPKQTRILGITNDASNVRALLKKTKASIKAKDGAVDAKELKKLGQIIELRQMDAVNAVDYPGLRDQLDTIEDEVGACTTRIFYLAVPPKIVPQIITQLGEHGLNQGCHKHRTKSRLLLEKPFGFDVETAEALIKTTTDYFHEDQIFRIDHYLAKETVQNIVTFRFRNPVFEDTWNSNHIQKIEISANENLDIEGRGRFYEQTGALRDLVQSHLLHVMSVIMMDRPIDINDADAIHECRVRLLESIDPVTPHHAIRGQYKGYKNEAGNPTSFVETFAALKLHSRAERWYNVPIFVKTGKALKAKETCISVYFRPEVVDHGHTNRLDFYIQPHEGIKFTFWVKKPGFSHTLETATMDFSYLQKFDENGHPDAYERVLVDAIRGDNTLFATSGEVLSAWKILEPIIKAWGKDDEGLEYYEKGSEGPSLNSLL